MYVCATVTTDGLIWIGNPKMPVFLQASKRYWGRVVDRQP